MGLSLGSALAVVNPALALSASTATGYADRQESRHSAKTQYKYNSWLQGQNQDFQKYMAQNAHQIEVDDLEKAGLNPAMSVFNGTAGAIAGSSSAQGTSAGNTSTSMTDAIGNYNAILNTQSAVKLNDSQEQLNRSLAGKTDKEAGVINPKALAEISNLKTNSALNTAKAEEARSNIELNKAKAEEAISSAEFNRRRASGKQIHTSVSGKAGNKLLGEIQGAISGGATW